MESDVLIHLLGWPDFFLIWLLWVACNVQMKKKRQGNVIRTWRAAALHNCICIGKQSLCCISQASNCFSSHRDRIISPSFMILLKKTEWWDGRGRECEVCQCHPTTTQTRRTLDILTQKNKKAIDSLEFQYLDFLLLVHHMICSPF